MEELFTLTPACDTVLTYMKTLVNNTYQVLRCLRGAGVVSGQNLSRRLGISRVGVWKHVQELRRQGYCIESSPTGYRLLSAPDLLLPGEFPGWEDRIYHFHEVDSTMRIARELARGDAEEGTLVLAESQSQGRGRLDRVWLSPPGGIYLTLVTRPKISPALATRVSLVASVSVATALRENLGVPACVKWPNDVLVGGRKVCGILAEMEAEPDAVRYINIGIGVNVNTPADPQLPAAVSLVELVGRPVDRREVTMRIVTDLLRRLRELTSASCLNIWRELSGTIGREVCVRQDNETICGVAVDIQESGALVVQAADGRRTAVVAGDCTYEGT
ncbi:MAG TPA: biotin--[acetyl-CoA-carboxylase] ligase [Dehalococcoidia bacterium]|nr:biotin--[acetyl-CoA-carboxylase] ligase [Dehalococcoidia bacterium]